MARTVITIGGKEVSLEPSPAGTADARDRSRGLPVSIAARPYALPAGRRASGPRPLLLALGVGGGALLLALSIFLCARGLRRRHSP